MEYDGEEDCVCNKQSGVGQYPKTTDMFQPKRRLKLAHPSPHNPLIPHTHKPNTLTLHNNPSQPLPIPSPIHQPLPILWGSHSIR